MNRNDLLSWPSHMFQDLRYAVRGLRRAPGFAGLVILILALGIGANLSTFSVIDAIMLRMLPVKDPGSLFRTVRADGNLSEASSGISYSLFLDAKKRTGALADLMAYQTTDLVRISIGQSEPEPMMQQSVSGNYFEVLGVQPALGRVIAPKDDREPGRQAVAVIGDRLWKSRFHGSPMAGSCWRMFGCTLRRERRSRSLIVS